MFCTLTQNVYIVLTGCQHKQRLFVRDGECLLRGTNCRYLVIYINGSQRHAKDTSRFENYHDMLMRLILYDSHLGSAEKIKCVTTFPWSGNQNFNIEAD
jgi:hypothetical protein